MKVKVTTKKLTLIVRGAFMQNIKERFRIGRRKHHLGVRCKGKENDDFVIEYHQSFGNKVMICI